jgi:glutamine synthetase
VFDDVRYNSTMNGAMYSIDSEEGPYVTGKKYPDGNMGHRPAVKGGYFPVPPVDSASDLRAEMLSVMLDMGLEVEKHHHEVAAVAARTRVRVLDIGENRRQHADL